jgi:hypothetical protein
MMRITRHLLIGATALCLGFAATACDDDGDNNTPDVVADVVADATPDTTADTTPDTTAGGPCTNAADKAIIDKDDPSPSGIAQSEGTACFLGGATEDAAFRTCTKDAVVAGSGVSDACADCYAGSALCAKNNCLTECLGGGQPCVDCRTTNGCTSDFYTCSGLTPPATATN